MSRTLFWDAQSFLDAGTAIRSGAGAVGFVKRRFGNERPGGHANFRRQKMDVLFTFDHTGTGDQRERLALADLNLWGDFDDHDRRADKPS